MGTSRNKIAAIAALSTIWPTIALPQQAVTPPQPGVVQPQQGAATAQQAQASPRQAAAGMTGGLQVDIGINSKLSVDDNFELTPTSNGTTVVPLIGTDGSSFLICASV